MTGRPSSAIAGDPAYTAYREHHGAARYSAEAVALLRAWAEPSLMDGLDPASADPFFAHVAARLAATPTECPWTIGLLRLRQHEHG